MTGFGLILVAVVGATVIWPINRWVMRNAGRPYAYGFWVSGSAAIISLTISLILRQSVFEPKIWLLGAWIGIAFSIGYCLIIMYCLRIGPLGPTTAMNNMGLVWPVAISVFWLKLGPSNVWIFTGLGLVVLSLVVFGFSSPKKTGQSQDQDKNLSFRWMLWALLGWVLAGISMVGQMLGGIYFSDLPFPVVFAYTSFSMLILSPQMLRSGKDAFRSKEIIPGIINGAIAIIIGGATLMAIRHTGAEIVFPFTVAGPIVLVLILGRIVYKERLTWAGLTACVLGLAGLLSLAMGRSQ